MAHAEEEQPGFGVYVHIPFCAHRCDYCDFATWTDRDHLVDTYVDACITDIGRRREAGMLVAPTSVFFGGGTPSLLPAQRLAAIVEAIAPPADAEVTVECNPDSVDRTSLATYHSAGVNRVSLGVQSMAPHVLQGLGRTHDPDNVARAVDAARAVGIERINLDVIYGTPGESTADWEATLRAVLALDPGHVSAYALTVEPGTPLGRDVAAGSRRAPDDDDQAHKYEVADDLLAAAGYRWYEVSNWARPGEECRHNVLYWTMGEYCAIGCAAHGHRQGRRWWNLRTPERYIEAIAQGHPPDAGSEELDATGRAEEAFTLALRTRGGAPLGEPAWAAAADLAAAGLLEPGPPGRAVLTRAGRLLASDVTARLLLAGATG